MTDSPLASTDPAALDLIFTTDPLQLSEQQLLTAILELRRRRDAFASEEAAKSLAPKKTRAAASKPPADVSLAKPITELSLDDLA